MDTPMPVKIDRKEYDTPTERMKLTRRKKPYWFGLGRKGVMLGYRRNKTAGTWSVRSTDANGKKWTNAFALADDHDLANGDTILTFEEAVIKAKALAGVGGGAPITLGQALIDYRAHLIAKDSDPQNADRVLLHLPDLPTGKPHPLKAKFVADLTNRDLKTICDGMKRKGLQPDTIIRIMKPLRAALNRAAADDRRITNVDVWKGERNVEPDNNCRRMALMNNVISDIITAAHAIDRRLGQIVEVLAQTGARISQVAKVRICDLKADGILIVPPSKKGKGRPIVARVAIPLPLCAELMAAEGHRPAQELLLLQSNGKPWTSKNIWMPFRKAVVAAGLDPDNYLIDGDDDPIRISSYSLRHSHIVDQLEKGIDPMNVALMHNTSQQKINSNYVRHAADRARDRLRAAVTDLSAARRANAPALTEAA
jgi:site-specific recombinase XerD